jgi:hypothetical protein
MIKRSEIDIKRRTFLEGAAYGLGSIALSSLSGIKGLSRETKNAHSNGIIQPLHYPIRARRIIHLCMAGGPSHIESFDYKPKLAELDGKPFPDSLTKGQQLAQLQNTELLARQSFVKFRKYGQSGIEVSDLFPNIATIVDDISVIKSMHTEQINHDPAHSFMNTGSIIKGRPSMGSWLMYGIGSEADNLPGFIVLTSIGQTGVQPISARQWSSGFLPTRFQGILFQSKGDAVHYVGNPKNLSRQNQRQVVDEINKLNEMLAKRRFDPEIQTRISQYEMAFKMQMSVPELTDFSSEPRHVLDMYGIKDPTEGTFASNCLMARRLAERGVRFIQLYHRGWDHHSGIEEGMTKAALETDRASAALVKDLKQRGLLDDTLVIWGGEFGRTPMAQGTGRDHHINAFSIWLAGGGVKGGLTYGETDELGYKYVKDGVHVHDLHATMLYLSGIDHTQLTFRYQGRDFRLTDVHGRVTKNILKES